jgi:endonuclease YncB( thermonuclease family)
MNTMGDTMNRAMTILAAMMITMFGATALQAQETIRVTKVIDGSTILVANGDTVSLIGVAERQGRYEDAADMADYLELTVGGTEVTLVADQASTAKEHGRKLRYVMVDGKLINLMLIQQGYASAAASQKHSKMTEFVAAEREAQRNLAGGWGIDRQISQFEQPSLASNR